MFSPSLSFSLLQAARERVDAITADKAIIFNAVCFMMLYLLDAVIGFDLCLIIFQVWANVNYKSVTRQLQNGNIFKCSILFRNIIRLLGLTLP